jgi:hypothetical protein
MPTFSETFTTKYWTYFTANFNTLPGAVATGMGANFTIISGAAALMLSNPTSGQLIQLAKVAESTLVSFSTGATPTQWSGLANAFATVAVGAVFAFSVPVTGVSLALGFTGALAAGALAQALFETVAEFYPGSLVQQAFNDTIANLNAFANLLYDAALAALDELPGALENLKNLITELLIGGAVSFEAFLQDALINVENKLTSILRDPLILDLDGDGIEVSALEGSTVFFDYDGDGVAERTGWASQDDGFLAIDVTSLARLRHDGNNTIDGIARLRVGNRSANKSELFGSPTQDGFAVLETFDHNSDGVIDADDAVFASLRVWRDLSPLARLRQDQHGVSDAGELQTLTEAGITEIALTRCAPIVRATSEGVNRQRQRVFTQGTLAGHGRGFAATFTRANGTTGSAETIYFQTDRQDTADPTPAFTPSPGVDQLPQLPRSGLFNNIAYTQTMDAAA